MSRRMLSLYFPCLAIDRLQREDPGRRAYPFAVTSEEKGHSYIAGVNAPANSAGISPGIRLTDARTLLPGLEALPGDCEADARVKERLIQWCDRYSPLVADDGWGGIALDITNCAHLFGGEAAVLKDIQARIRVTGYRVRGAIADTLGAAWALARYGKRTIVAGPETPEALGPLPVRALRLPEEIVQKLRRVGLTTIAALRKIPRQALATRYGGGILLRLDQAMGAAEETISAYREASPYRFERALAEPIGTVSALQYVLLDLLKEACSRLEKEHAGARQLNLDCCRVDGTTARCCVGTSKPVRSVTHLMRLFSEKLDLLHAGFGFEKAILSISGIDRSDPAQLNLPQFEQGLEEEEALDGLIDRLGMRLSFQEVCRFRVRESFLPEFAVEFRPVNMPVIPNAAWPENRLRPVSFIDPPVRIEVFTLPPDEAPLQFRLGDRIHRIVKAEGPERLTSEWWHDRAACWDVRDYYRVEDNGGARFWIFRETNVSSRSNHWFLQGNLA